MTLYLSYIVTFVNPLIIYQVVIKGGMLGYLDAYELDKINMV
jgi:hypothetical protein